MPSQSANRANNAKPPPPSRRSTDVTLVAERDLRGDDTALSPGACTSVRESIGGICTRRKTRQIPVPGQYVMIAEFSLRLDIPRCGRCGGETPRSRPAEDETHWQLHRVAVPKIA